MDTTRRAAALTFAQPLLVDLCTIDGSMTQVLAELAYDSHDPFAIGLVFRANPRPVRWTFSRDLLSDGLEQPTGDGDVHVWSCLDDSGLAVVMVELCSPSGDALVQFRLDDAVSFVDRVYAAVPLGDESDHLDVDAAIAGILAAEAR